MMADVRIEVLNEGVYDLPEKLDDLINKLCDIRGEVPEKYRDSTYIEFRCGDYSSDYEIFYWRPKNDAELKADVERAEQFKARRIRELEAELAMLQ